MQNILCKECNEKALREDQIETVEEEYQKDKRCDVCQKYFIDGKDSVCEQCKEEVRGPLTVKEAAKIKGVSMPTIRKWAKDGVIDSEKWPKLMIIVNQAFDDAKTSRRGRKSGKKGKPKAKELDQTTQKSLTVMSEMVEASNQIIEEQKKEIANLRQELETTKLHLENEKAALGNAEIYIDEKLAEGKKEIAKLEESLEYTKQENEELGFLCTTLRDREQKLEEILKEKENVPALQNELNSRQSKINSLKNDNTRLEEKNKSLTEEMMNMQKRIDSLTVSNKELAEKAAFCATTAVCMHGYATTANMQLAQQQPPKKPVMAIDASSETEIGNEFTWDMFKPSEKKKLTMQQEAKLDIQRQDYDDIERAENEI